MTHGKRAPNPPPAGRAFGEAVRKCRLQAGISQEKLAELADLSRDYISLIELGKVTPSIAVALKLAAALNTAVGDLIATVREKLP
jgi:XRE family transcriptional regulator, regulator of sulfur utilization